MDKSTSKEDPMLDAFYELDNLHMETANGQLVSGTEAHDTLFGQSQLYERLMLLEARLPGFRDQFQGNVVSIADFAVQSGHEALAFFASRVANYVRVRRKTITDLKSQLAEAEARGNSVAAEHIRSELMKASEYFAKTIQSAFKGWFEHRAWIRRSIEAEVRRANGAGTAIPAQASDSAAAPRQAARKRLHEAVKAIAGNLSNLLQLMGSYSSPPDKDSWVSHGLMWLDQHWKDLDAPITDDDPTGRSKQWRATLKDLRSHLKVAGELWDTDSTGPDTRLSLDFARVGKSAMACGPLNDATFHGLLIQLCMVILDPLAPSVVPQYAIAALEGTVVGLGGLEGVVRIRAVRDLRDRQWWRTMSLALDREYADVLALSSLAGHGTSSAAPTPMVATPPTVTGVSPVLGDVRDDLGVRVSPREFTPQKMLTGWPDILQALGLEPKSRKHKDIVFDLNTKHGGPIRWISKKRPSADAAALSRWWSDQLKRAEDSAIAEPRQEQSAPTRALQNAGVRKELGFHLKSSPNKLRRDS